MKNKEAGTDGKQELKQCWSEEDVRYDQRIDKTIRNLRLAIIWALSIGIGGIGGSYAINEISKALTQYHTRYHGESVSMPTPTPTPTPEVSMDVQWHPL